MLPRVLRSARLRCAARGLSAVAVRGAKPVSCLADSRPHRVQRGPAPGASRPPRAAASVPSRDALHPLKPTAVLAGGCGATTLGVAGGFAKAAHTRGIAAQAAGAQGIVSAAGKDSVQAVEAEVVDLIDFGARERVEERDYRDEEGEEGEEEGEYEELSECAQVHVTRDFLTCGRALRDHFETRFREPRSNDPERFVWDYWFVENQYCLVRTQAQVFFPEDLYQKLEAELVNYGERVLGCRSITPIWLSYYVDGCGQELHCDNPHGPFAFVLSLTNWTERSFSGGETMILQPRVLSYWESFDPRYGLELTDLTRLVEPNFNQLTVFDPRLPHGVRTVHGTRNPLKARLVLHGWFTDPTPFFEGGLDETEAASVLATAMDALMSDLSQVDAACGVLTIRLKVDGGSGRVEAIEFLADTLMPLAGAPYAQTRAAIQHLAADRLLELQFPGGASEDTYITLPLVFE